jgi:uncharacterized iron-regulated membrane protein
MSRLAILFVLAFAAVARADVTTEKDLRATVAILRARVDALTAMNAALVAKLPAAGETKTHAAERGAVLQAQAETTQTNGFVTDSQSRQIEFEKQLTALQVDLHKVVGLQQNAMYMLVVLFILVASFTGTVVYSNRRPRVDARTE